MLRLTKIILLDVFSILCYVVYIWWCALYDSGGLDLWYEWLLFVVGEIAIGNAIVVKSKIVLFIGIVTICVAMYVIM